MRPSRIGAVVALVGFAAVRVWLAIGGPVSWSDTRSYDVQASKSLLSARFWEGRKPPGFPFLLKVVGSHESVIVAQVALGIVAWAVLARVVASFAREGWPSLVALGAVLGLAITKPVAIWDRVMLSESLALSLLALLVATLVLFAQRPGWLRLLAVVVVAGAWISVRDTDIYVVLGIALVRHSAIALPVAVAAVVLLLGGGAALALSTRSVRGVDPLRHVLSDRILPYPDRLAWWQGHGMPQANALRRLERHPGHTDTGALTVGPSARDRHFARYTRWVRDDGAKTYVEWLVTHPSYTLFEPFERPERVHLHRTVGEYAPGANTVPLVSRLYFPPWPVSTAIFVVLSAIGIAWRRFRDVSWWVGVGLVLLAVPHLLLAWHGDAASPIRHGLIGNVQAQLGILVVGLALLPRSPSDGMGRVSPA